jgi:hypothetical protein
MAEDISRISSGTLSELELKLDGVGRIRTSGLQRPRLASYQARQRPLVHLMLHGIVRGHNFKFVWLRQYLYIELGHTDFNGFS